MLPDMPYELRRMSRPLTDRERAPIEAARRKIEKLQRQLDAATAERDRAIFAAYDRRVRVDEIAQAGGVARQTIHVIVKRLADSGDNQA